MKNLKGKATQKQLDALTKFGIKPSKELSKQEASNLISAAIEMYNSKEKHWSEKPMEQWTDFQSTIYWFLRS